MNEVIRILIVDDHPIVREGLVAMLSRRADLQVAGEAGNGREALALCAATQPDIVLTDLRMPEMDGVALIHHLREVAPQTRVIVLTTYDGDEDIYRALAAGAMAYLLKDAPRDELLTTIRAVYNGRRHIPPEVAARLAERMTATELTERELAVLHLIAQGHSNKSIGDQLHIAEGTVKAHVNSILSKLNARDRTHAVTIAYQRGLISLR